MTSTEKCGITTLFVMSCRGRAEAFARHLHTRLSSLNKEQSNEEPSETTWLGKNDQIALAQPKHQETTQNELPVSSSDCLINNDGRLFTCVPLRLENEEIKLEDDAKSLDVSISSTEYDTCQDDSRTLTEESFTSLENDILKDDFKGNDIIIKNEYYDDIEEEMPLNGVYVEITEVCCNGNCDINNDICDDSLQNSDLLSIDNESSSIPNGDYQDEELTPLRRCSSLRTGKTPPGTPARKKIVRFADVLGLDLADVRTFLDEIPKIPNSAFNDLQEANLTFTNSHSPEKILIPLFTQPGGLPDFLQRVRDNKVCLENALVEDVCLMSVKGTVRVLNLDYHKTVHVRYSIDGWRSFSDLQCTYLVNSCDGFSDKFTFLVYANMLKVGEKLEFAVRYQSRNVSYWDNNDHRNYSFQCLPSTNTMLYSPITTEEPWATAFY